MPIEAFKRYIASDGNLDAEATLTVWARQLNYLFKNLDQNNISSTTLTLGSNQVKAINIDFGVGLNQVDASDIPITDASSYFVGDTVELALAQLGSTILNLPAENVKITDTGAYYTSTSVESALQEVGKLINSTSGNTVIFSTANININSTDGQVNIDADNIIWVNTVYDDIRVPAVNTNAGTLRAPNLVKFKDNGAGSQGVYTYQFDDSLEEELLFSMQIPHAYKTGTDLLPHVHWSPTTTGTGNVVWGLEYTIQSIHETYGNTIVDTATATAGTTAYAHQVKGLTNISGLGLTESAMLLGRVFRDATSTNDTYAADAALLEIDFHYQKEKIGTDSIMYP